jgi:hypothetical protein
MNRTRLTQAAVAPAGGDVHHVGRVTPADEVYVDARVYRQTIDHRPPVGVIYLPCVLRRE